MTERVTIRRVWYVVCLVLVLGGAGAIRLFRLDTIPVDSDEAATLSWLAEPTCWKMLRSVAADLVNQPLYPLLLRLWRDIRGDSVQQLRELGAPRVDRRRADDRLHDDRWRCDAVVPHEHPIETRHSRGPLVV